MYINKQVLKQQADKLPGRRGPRISLRDLMDKKYNKIIIKLIRIYFSSI